MRHWCSLLNRSLTMFVLSTVAVQSFVEKKPSELTTPRPSWSLQSDCACLLLKHRRILKFIQSSAKDPSPLERNSRIKIESSVAVKEAVSKCSFNPSTAGLRLSSLFDLLIASLLVALLTSSSSVRLTASLCSYSRWIVNSCCGCFLDCHTWLLTRHYLDC